MKTYEKPSVVSGEGLSEGVYMDSGKLAADCWTIEPYSTQNWSGEGHIFRVRCVHTSAVKHISTAANIALTFSNTITYARSEGGNISCEFSGNIVRLVRTLHANAYNSGDNVDFMVVVRAADQATTEALSCTGATISCTKTANVQGEID